LIYHLKVPHPYSGTFRLVLSARVSSRPRVLSIFSLCLLLYVGISPMHPLEFCYQPLAFLTKHFWSFLFWVGVVFLCGLWCVCLVSAVLNSPNSETMHSAHLLRWGGFIYRPLLLRLVSIFYPLPGRSSVKRVSFLCVLIRTYHLCLLGWSPPPAFHFACLPAGDPCLFLPRRVRAFIPCSRQIECPLPFFFPVVDGGVTVGPRCLGAWQGVYHPSPP